MFPGDWNESVDAMLRKVEDGVNEELARQYVQLGDSLRDFLYELFNYPLERPWRDSLAIFAEHWTDRGLRLTPRTLNSIGQLIAEELGRPEDAFDADDVDASSNAAEGTILLAAAPRRGGAQGKQKTTTEKSTGHRAEGKPSKTMPFGKRLPAGEWIQGTEGNGVLKLDEPIRLSGGETVKEIPFKDGLPIYDRWQLKGEDVVIAITGDRKFDGEQALEAWKARTGKTALHEDYIFHHDGQVREIMTHRGKRVFVGRMQPIPKALHKSAHIGSVKIALPFHLDRDAAREINALALKGRGPLAAVRKNVRSMLAKRARQFRRAIPIIGGALTVIYFADDVQAHGLGGAIVRATPLLGDIVTAYDVGKAVGDEIVANALYEQERAYKQANDPVQAAQAAARKATVDAFNQIARNLHITKQYIQPDEVIDAIKEPLREFYEEAYSAHFQKHQLKPVPYPPGTTPSQATKEPALEMRLRMAREKLERSLKQRLQRPPARGGQPFA